MHQSIKVGPVIRNGERSSYVEEDQDDFDSVERANIGTSKMDNGMESNDEWKMDQEWNKVFEMMEQASLTHGLSEFGTVNAGYGRTPFGMHVCSKTPQNLINQCESETVRSILCIS